MRGSAIDPATIDVYVAREVRCPYLPGRRERKLLVPLDGDANAIYDTLIALGFRRSGRWAYRPRCSGCVACVPVRVDVAAFSASRSQRRAARANAGLRLTRDLSDALPEAYAIFSRYLEARHASGEMAGMGEREFQEMVRSDVVRTELWGWRDEGDALVAGLLVDVVADGISLVYSFFDPARSARSPGVAIVLAAIDEARRRALPYVYLGYWVDGCDKMTYKASFAGLQAFGGVSWRPISLPDPREAATQRAAGGGGDDNGGRGGGGGPAARGGRLGGATTAGDDERGVESTRARRGDDDAAT